MALYGNIYKADKGIPECQDCAYQNSVEATHQVMERMYREGKGMRDLLSCLLRFGKNRNPSEEKR